MAGAPRILRAREEDPAPLELEVAYQDRSFSIETWLDRAIRRRDSDDGVLEPSLLVTFCAPDRQGAWPATAFAACSLAATILTEGVLTLVWELGGHAAKAARE
jgi:hypothetical protein